VSADPIAEQHVIGSVIHSAGAALDGLDLTDEDFSQLAHARLWRAISKYLETGKPLTDTLFLRYLEQHGAHELLPALTNCLTAGVIPQQAPHYANLLRIARGRRNLEAAAAAFLQLAQSPGDYELPELYEAAREQADRFLTATTRAGGMTSIAETALYALDQRWGKPDINFLPTGWRDLDDKLNGGLRPGHLTVVGARPSVGKSFVATQLGLNVASRGGPTLFHSLEMSSHELTDRVMSSYSRIPLDTLNAGTADEYDLDKLGDRVGEVLSWPLYIDDYSGVTITGIRSRARDLKRKGKLSLLIVDYLQLITPLDGKAPRHEQVGSLSRALKLLAKELDVPVVALAQLNRESGGSERPKMHHLRESGSIEADADEIILLYRSDEPDMFGQVEFIVEKNRHGSTGSVRLAFLPQAALVADL
jgi:replicative DNA helicase